MVLTQLEIPLETVEYLAKSVHVKGPSDPRPRAREGFAA